MKIFIISLVCFFTVDAYSNEVPPCKESLCEISMIHIITTIFFLLYTIILLWRNWSLKQANKKLQLTKEALANSENKFRIFSELTEDVFWFIKPEFKELIYVSPAYEKIWGKSLASLYEDPTSYFKQIHPEDTCKLHEESGMLDKPRAGEKYRVVNAKTREVKWVRSQMLPYKNNKGEIEFIAGLTSDITDLVNSQDEIALQKQLVAQQSKFASMGEMLSSITHQWKQPLNSLYLCIQLMEDNLKEDQVDIEEAGLICGDCLNLVEHMSDTISDFRHFFQSNDNQVDFDAPKTVLHTMRILAPLFKENNIDYEIRCKCESKSFECINNLNANDDVCSHPVKGMPNEFKHAVLNILQNAAEALVKTSDTDRKISVKMLGDREKISITIKDNGGGIPDETLPKIFDPYVSSKKEGTGIGLYMAKTIIKDKMKGKISAENDENGAIFSIELPVSN